MVLAAGKLRHHLKLERKSEQQDAMGEPVRGWDLETMLWGAVRPLGVSERTEAAKLVGEATHLVTVRGLEAKITPDKRFVFSDMMGDHILEVVGEMNYDMASFEVRVMCRERL